MSQPSPFQGRRASAAHPHSPSHPQYLPTIPGTLHAHDDAETEADTETRWERASAAWQERRVGVPWPPGLLEAFCLRMSSHGLPVSQVLMIGDRQYALKQLVDAHSLADDGLRLMSVQLFRFFEAHQAGRSWLQ